MDFDESTYRPPSPPPWQASDHPEIKLRMIAMDLAHLREQTASRLSAKARLIQACQDRLLTDEQRLGGHQDRLTEITARVDLNAEKIEVNTVHLARHDKEISALEERTAVVHEVAQAVRKFIQGRNIIVAAVIAGLLASGRLSPDAVFKWLGLPPPG